MQTGFKKLLSFLLVFTMICSLVVGLVPMTAAAAGETISISDAPYAGVYQVTSNKAVTLTNETGSTATLSAGGTKYIYLIKGANNMTKSVSTATVTYTALANNGLDYLNQVTFKSQPVITGQEDTVAMGLNKTLTPGASYTFQYTPSAGKNGIVYPYILYSAGSEATVTTDTGFTTKMGGFGGQSGTTWAWQDSARSVPALIYVRAGENNITITNSGGSNLTIANIKIHSVGEYKPESTMNQLTPISVEELNATPTPSPTPTAKPTATPAPTPTPTPAANVITYTAPAAGVYKVTSDKAVTLVNETGSKAVLSANGNAYIYMIEGANKLTTTDKSASLTFIQLENNGLNFLSNIVVDYIPYGKEHVQAQITKIVDSEGTYQVYGNQLILNPGAMVVVKATMSKDGAGIVYPYLNVQDNYTHTFKISSDTGFYAEILKNATGYQTTCWADGTAQQDMEFLYVREGDNLITIENTGANTATIGYLRLSMTDGTDSLKNHATWGPQMKLASLKTIEREIVATPEPTAPPQATFAPVGTITYDAPGAGVYRVASDKAVTLINETGSTATLSGSGVVKYLYLIKGANKLSTSDLSATITFTQLDAFGMNQMAKVETAYTAYGKQHVTPTDIHSFVDASGTYQTGTNDNGKFVNLSPGGSITFELTMGQNGAGIVYPYLGVIDEAENKFEITSDTGFYAEIYKPATAGSYCWADADKQDIELLYAREGKNLITIKNVGSSIATVTAFRLSMTDGEDGLTSHEIWGPQMNLQNLKIFSGYSSEPIATPEPVLPDVSNTNLYTVIEAETTGTATTYNGKTAVKFDHEMVTSASYTFNAEQETVYNLNLIGAAWKDVSFDLYVDGTLVDYATMHFHQDKSSTWTYLQEEVASIHVGAGSHTLKFDFYCDTFYFDAIVLEDTNSMYYHLIHDFATVTTAESAYNLLKQYGSAAGIDVDADTVNHVYAPMSFWSMAGKNFETASEMLDAYTECIIDPAVIVKNSGGQEVAVMPEGTAYVSADCQYIPAEVSLFAAVYNGKQLVSVSAMTRADSMATTAFTQLPAGCTLKVLVMNDLAEAAPYSGEVYGTPYREIYVATTGKSNAAGTKDAPVNNLVNALKIVKTINNDMTGDIIINVAPGTYKTSVSIDIDPTMGGKNGHKVIIRAEDPDNQPVISGGEDLTGKWTKVDGQNYYVAKTTTRETRALFVNGYQATMARSEAWYSGALIDPATPKNDAHVTDGILVSFYGNSSFPKGLDEQTAIQSSRMHIVFSLQWANHRFPLDRIEYDANNAYIYTTYPYYNAFCIDGLHTSTITPGQGTDFYLENSLLLLDKPGEFYFDKEAQKMYYYPYAQENMATAETWCATTDRTMNITGVGSQNKVTNLEFDGIAFRYGGYDDITVKGAAFNQTEEWRLGSESYYGQHIFPAQIWVNYADGVTFKNCEFGSMGSSALIFEEGVSNSGVYGSYFHDLAGTGVILGDYRDGNAAPVSTERCQNLTVDNNIFRRTAQEYQGLTAISVYYVGNATITHNDIKDTSYSGIVVGWGWGYDDPANCGNHNISYNKIENVMQTMGDGAHIYTLGNLRGTQINDNYVIDPGQIKAPGIYFDQGTGYTFVSDNVVTGASGSDYWFFARQLVNINNCFAGYNHTDGADPTSKFGTNGTSRKDVTLSNNKYKVTTWSTTAQKIMAAAGVEDKARLNEIDTYPTWRTMRMLDIPN